MSDVKKKIERWNRLKDLTEQVQEEMQRLVQPVLELYGYRHGEVTNIAGAWGSNGTVQVTVRIQFRGDSDTREFLVPEVVLYAENLEVAIAEAKLHKEKEEAARVETNRLENINRLERELKLLKGIAAQQQETQA